MKTVFQSLCDSTDAGSLVHFIYNFYFIITSRYCRILNCPAVCINWRENTLIMLSKSFQGPLKNATHLIYKVQTSLFYNRTVSRFSN